MRARYITLAALVGLGLWGVAAAQVDYGGRLGDRVGDRVIYYVPGVITYIEALDPTVQRWYMPAPLFGEFGRNQWEYTNYARQAHKRYINPASEGDLFYDPFGRLITRGLAGVRLAPDKTTDRREFLCQKRCPVQQLV